MADLTLVQGIADLRLNDATLRQDLQRARRLIADAAREVERQLAVNLPLTIDTSSIRAEIRRVQTAIDSIGAVDVPIGADALGFDEAVEAAEQEAVEPITKPVEADTEPFTSGISEAAEEESLEQVTLEVASDTEAFTSGIGSAVDDAREEIGGLGSFGRDRIRQDLANISDLDLVVPIEPDIDTAPLDAIADEPRRVRLEPETSRFDEFLGGLPGKVSDAFSTVGAGFTNLFQSAADDADLTVDVVPNLAPVQAGLDEVDGTEIDATIIPDDGLFQQRLDEAEGREVAVELFAELGRLRGQIDGLNGTEIETTILADAARLEAALDNAEGREVGVELFAELGRLRGQVDGLQDRIGPLAVDIDTDGVDEFGDYAQGVLPDDFAQAGQDAGRSFGESAIGALRGVFITGGVALGGFLATSLVRGFQRFTTIQDSVASLTVQLGDATAAAELLDEVLGVVTGTPFDLDQFAEAASNLVAFGVEAEKIPTYLTAISEVAATRGGRANEFAQRLAISFGQVAVQGRITNDEINQLALTGVPALQILGNELNVTSGEARELISKGLVPANEALDALATGILEGSDGINGATVAFAGTAEALRETLTGSIGGFRSATARFGVSIIEPLEGVLIAGFQGATAAVDAFGASVRDVLGGFAESDQVQSFIGVLQDLPNLADGVIAGFDALGAAAAPLAAVFAGIGLGQIANLLGPLGNFLPGITGPLGAVITGLTALIATEPELRERFLPVLLEIGEIGLEVAAILGPAIGDAVESVIPLFVSLLDVVEDLLPVFRNFAVGGASVLAVFGDALEVVADVLGVFPTEVLTAIVAGIIAFRTIGAIGPSLVDFSNGLGRVSASAAKVVPSLKAANAEFAEIRTQASLANRVAIGAAAGIAGAFSGIALAADDTSTQVSGLVGAISAIGTGAVIGGGPGAALAAVGTAVGLVAGEFINARREAEEFKRAVRSSVDEILIDVDKLTNAVGEIDFDIEGFTLAQDPASVKAYAEQLGSDIIDLLSQLPDFDLSDLLNIPVDFLEPAIDKYTELRDVVNDISTTQQVLANTDADPLGTIALSPLQDLSTLSRDLQSSTDRLPANAEELAEALGSTREEFERFALTNQDIVDQQLNTNRSYNELLDRRAELLRELGQDDLPQAADPDTIDDLVTALERRVIAEREVSAELQVQLSLQQQAFQQALDAATEPFFDPEKESDFFLSERQVDGIKERAIELGVTVNDLVDRFEGFNAEQTLIFDNASRFIEEGIDPFDVFILGIEEVEERFGVVINFLEDGTVQIADAGDDAFNRLTDSGSQSAEDVEDAWASAVGNIIGDLDGLGGAIDRISARGDLAASLRGIGEGLDAIVNEADLRNAERIADQVDRQLERVRDAAQDLEEAQVEFSFNEQIALENIAAAEAAGSTRTAAAARRDLELDRLGVRQLADDLAAEEARLAELQNEAAAAAATGPITFADVLFQQAADSDLSLFDLLISQPTDESQEAFRRYVDEPASQALAIIEDLISEGDYAGALEAARTFAEQFEAEWSRYWGPETSAALLAEVFDLSQFDTDLSFLGVLSGEAFKDGADGSLDGYVAEVKESSLSDEDFAYSEVQDFITQAQQALDEDGGELFVQIGLDPAQVEAQLTELEQVLFEWLATLPPPNLLISPTAAPERNADPYQVQVLKIGGFHESDGPHTAHIARTLRVFGEPETGGEAYIPLTPDPVQRRRSEMLLGDVASRFGFEILPIDAEPSPVSVNVAAPAMPSGAMSAVVTNTDRIAAAVADGVTNAMVTSRKSQMAHDYGQAVQIEHLHIGSGGSDRRTARRVINELADLSLRRGRRR